jgi:photosynthetic reaction center H subunit
MPVGAITSHLDVAQVVLYAFWIFFFGLVLYLRREDQREGYPLENESGPAKPGAFYPPAPKEFVLPGGGKTTSNRAERKNLSFRTLANFIGMPIEPEGNELAAGVGPGSYCERADVPDQTFDGHNRIIPTRVAGEYGVMEGDADPRGFEVVGSDGAVAGKVVDLWADRAEFIFRYYEVELAGGGNRLLPVGFGLVNRQRRKVYVDSITAKQFAGIPTLKDADQVTRREEDQIMAFYGGGYLYSTRARREAWL